MGIVSGAGELTLSQLLSIAALVAVLIGYLGGLFGLWHRFIKLERSAAYRQQDSAIMFMCLRGCLEGLVQVGANGQVKEALKNLNEYTNNKAAGLPGKA